MHVSQFVFAYILIIVFSYYLLVFIDKQCNILSIGAKMKKFLLGLLIVILVFITSATAYFFIAKPWIPPIVVVDPPAGAVRINSNGVIGNYFAIKDSKKHPAVLLFGGSEGGISKQASNIAIEINKAGLNVLNISFFRAQNQNPELINVPLETFDKALEFLTKQNEVDAKNIAIVGASKGGEAALLIASRHPEIKVIVAGMPSSVVWAGFSWHDTDGSFKNMKSSWTLGGKEVPFLPFGDVKSKNKNENTYSLGLKEIEKHQNAIIPIEKSKAKILLICGEDDTLWPSCQMARMVEGRAKANSGPQVTILSYKDAGHGVFGTIVDPKKFSSSQLAFFGGSVEGNAKARQDNFPKTINFLQENLK